MAITFRLILEGARLPADASFVIQDGFADGARHAVYLCNYYGGYPACGSGEAYEDVLTAPPGTEVIYHVWRRTGRERAPRRW